MKDSNMRAICWKKQNFSIKSILTSLLKASQLPKNEACQHKAVQSTNQLVRLSTSGIEARALASSRGSP